MAKIIFLWYLISGTVQFQEKIDNKKLYNINFKDSTVIEYAYKGEVIKWIKTGEFKYDEDLADSAKSCDLEYPLSDHICIDTTHVKCESSCICDGIECHSQPY